jgi:hypothetical protein
MNKRGRRIVVGVVAALVVAVLCILEAPYLYYSTASLQILPARLIRHAVRFTTGHALPKTMDAAQGIIHGGRDVGVFVRLHTDKAGIQYILGAFGGPDAKTETFDEKSPRFWSGFTMPEVWQERLGVSLYDRKSIRSATVITCQSRSDDVGYVLLIDLDRDDVYIFGMGGSWGIPGGTRGRETGTPGTATYYK